MTNTVKMLCCLLVNVTFLLLLFVYRQNPVNIDVDWIPPGISKVILQASGGRENQESGQDEVMSFKNGTGEWKLPGVIIIGEKIMGTL